jgi:RNA polymerase sigma-B factor
LAALDIAGKDTAQLIQLYKETGDLTLRNIIVERNLRLAEGIASRFAGRGVEYEDLLQVASMALIGAIERFDPARGFKFSTFAAPTIIGEIKNYFRDKTRMMHISRRDSEQLMAFSEVKDSLEKRGMLTVSDLAQAMQLSEERVLELMEMQRSVSVSSLERIIGDEENESAIKDFLGSEDEGFAHIETKAFIEKAFTYLDEVEQRILKERFWQHLPQSAVAANLGVSQMYISRAERRILKKLRTYME